MNRTSKKTIEKKIEEYQRTLEEADAADEKTQKQDTGNDKLLGEKTEKLKRRAGGLWPANGLKQGKSLLV